MSLKAISIRVKSIKNIQKITKSMKMVSASKYARAERELRQAKGIGQAANHFYKSVEVEGEKVKPQKLFIAISSDKGLCGGVHTRVCATIRKKVAAEGPNVKIVAVGDKSRNILQRYVGEYLILTANDYGRKLPTFLDASLLTSAIINLDYKYNCGEVIFNKFNNVVSYSTTFFPVFSQSTVELAPKASFYDIEDSVLLQNYLEFSLLCLIYYAMKEGNTAEHASRMTAMDSASQNAGEMLGKLNTKFNRTRQASITRELNEIISGASVVQTS